MKILLTAQNTQVYLDDEDFDYYNQWTWHLGDNGYAQRGPRSGTVLLHIEIMKRHGLHIQDHYVDHVDRLKHNCCKYNLRMATPSQSQANCLKPNRTSDYRGIFPAVSNIKNGRLKYDLWVGKFVWVLLVRKNKQQGLTIRLQECTIMILQS